MKKSEEIIDKLGGKSAVAEKLGLTRGAVSYWFYPRPNGYDGNIPAKSAIKVLKLAQEKGIECKLEDLMGE